VKWLQHERASLSSLGMMAAGRFCTFLLELSVSRSSAKANDVWLPNSGRGPQGLDGEVRLFRHRRNPAVRCCLTEAAAVPSARPCPPRLHRCYSVARRRRGRIFVLLKLWAADDPQAPSTHAITDDRTPPAHDHMAALPSYAATRAVLAGRPLSCHSPLDGRMHAGRRLSCSQGARPYLLVHALNQPAGRPPSQTEASDLDGHSCFCQSALRIIASSSETPMIVSPPLVTYVRPPGLSSSARCQLSYTPTLRLTSHYPRPERG